MKFILNENQIANETQVAQGITLMLQIELTKAGLNAVIRQGEADVV